MTIGKAERTEVREAVTNDISLPLQSRKFWKSQLAIAENPRSSHPEAPVNLTSLWKALPSISISIINISDAQVNLSAGILDLISAHVYLKLHLENNDLLFSFAPKSFVIAYCWQILTCCVHKEGDPGRFDFSAVQEKSQKWVAQWYVIENNSQAHILIQEVRTLGNKILFPPLNFFFFIEYCCYSLFSFVLWLSFYLILHINLGWI